MSFALCVVGCGRFAKSFAKEVRSFSGLGSRDQVELFFASRDRERASSYCRMFEGSDFFDNYEDAAADPRVQAMYFCTPHHLHLEHVLMAARFSKHILVEKPIARTLGEGERMVAAAKDAGVKLMVAENFRFMPVVKKSRELIQQGVIGALRTIQIKEESNFLVEGWRANREMMGGGVLIDGGIHSVDILIDLAGMPEEVYASILPKKLRDVEGEDGIVVTARLKSGGTGLISHAWGYSGGSPHWWVAASGTGGRIQFQPNRSNMYLGTDGGRRRYSFPKDRSGIGNMVREFRDSIMEDRPPLMSGEEGLRDLKVVLRVYESAARGVPVAVN